MGKSAVIDSYNNNLLRAIAGIRLEDRAMPVPAEGEALIRVSAAPINPSDIAFLRGVYGIVKPLPAVPGFEGAGLVVDAGTGAKGWIGKKVSFFVQNITAGAWAEYVVTEASDCLPIDDRIPVNQAACFPVNPFTAFGLVEMAAEAGAEMIVQNAAGSQVAAFVRFLAGKRQMDVLNIVRSNETAERLRSEGYRCLLSTADDFTPALQKYTTGRKTAVFDAVGGEMSGILINAMPKGANWLLFGGLSGAAIANIDPLEVIFKDKRLEGFNLNTWRSSKKSWEIAEISLQLQNILLSGECTTQIRETYPLSEITPAIRSYLKNMSAGKVLLIP